MELLADRNVVEAYKREHQVAIKNGVDKKSPNLSLVRLVGMYFQAKNGALLDYGCGFGSNTVHLLNTGFNVTAVDTSPYAIEKLQSKVRDNADLTNRLHTEVIDPRDSALPFDDNSFDFVVCSSVLSLLASTKRIKHVISDFSRVLKPGGKAYLDINSTRGFFAEESRDMGSNVYETKGYNNTPRLMYCPSDPDQFKACVEPYLIVDEIGFHGHSFFNSKEEEFIICARKA